jgi:hypothetical protein
MEIFHEHLGNKLRKEKIRVSACERANETE